MGPQVFTQFYVAAKLELATRAPLLLFSSTDCCQKLVLAENGEEEHKLCKLVRGERNPVAYDRAISISVVYCVLWKLINLQYSASALLDWAQPLQLAAVMKESEK